MTLCGLEIVDPRRSDLHTRRNWRFVDCKLCKRKLASSPQLMGRMDQERQPELPGIDG